MKRGKTLIGLLLVLAVLLGATAIAQKLNPELNVEETEEVTLLELDTEAVTNLSWSYEDETVALTHGEEGWAYEADSSFPLQQSRPDSMVSTLASLSVDKMIETPAELSEYGLDEPVCTIQVTAGEETEILVGGENSMDGGRYVSIGDGKVYLVEDSLLDVFSGGLYDLVEKEKLPNLTRLKGVTIDGETVSLELCYLEDSGLAYSDEYTWFLREGETYLTLDPERTDSLLEHLQGLYWGACVDYKADEAALAEYGLDTPAVTVTADYTETVQVETGETDEDGNTVYDTEEREGTFVLEIGDYEGDSCYARIAGSQMVYLIDASVCDALLYTGYDALRPDDILRMDWDTVTAIDITLDGAEYHVERTVEEVTDDEGETSEETFYRLDGAELALEDVLDELLSMESTGSQDGLTPQRESVLRFRFYRNTDTFQEVELVFYRYHSASCLVELNGECRLFADRETVDGIADELEQLLSGEETAEE